MRLVIFGPQGAGKGTQGAMIAEKYGIPAISTGDSFRWAIAAGTDLGREVEPFVAAGKLAPDDITIRVVRERLGADDCDGGFLLDGFPRNIVQAEALDALLAELEVALDAVLILEVPEEVSLERITGRAAAEGRTDDKDEATVRRRLQVYQEETAPLKTYYQERGLLRVVDGLGTVEDVFARITAVL